MKKSLLFAAALASTSAIAQLPDGVICPNFTGTDIDGNTHTLYDYLDQGYTVVIDVSATWCGPCWSYHNSGALEDLYDTYGPGTTEDKVMVFYIEGDGSTTLADLQGTGGNTQGDWVTGTNYPIIDDASIGDLLEITYFPTIYTVCPNRVITESGQITTAAHWTLAQTCPVAVAGTNAALASYNSETLACGALDMEVSLQNMGTSALTSATIAVKEGANTLATQNWTGSLNTYDMTDVTFANVTVSNPGAVTINITTNDALAADNVLDPGLVAAPPAMANVTFNLTLDWWCAETTWKLFNGNGQVMEQGGPYVCSNNGGGQDADQTKTFSWNLPLDCYKLEIYDSFGDGLGASQWPGNHPDGGWLVHDGGLNYLSTGSGDFGDLAKGGWDVNQAAAVNEQSLDRSLSVYPNPTNGIVTLTYGLNTASPVAVEVRNVLGALVMNSSNPMPSGNQMQLLDMSHLENGIYFINIDADGYSATRKVTLNR